MVRGLVLDLHWDEDQLRAGPAGLQRVRRAVLPAVFFGLAVVLTIATLVAYTVMGDLRVLIGLGLAAVFAVVGLVTRAVTRRLASSMSFVLSRSRGYQDGTVWHEWRQVRRVSVSRDVAHTLHVELLDGSERAHVLGQVGWGVDTTRIEDLLPSYVPSERLDLAAT